MATFTKVKYEDAPAPYCIGEGEEEARKRYFDSLVTTLPKGLVGELSLARGEKRWSIIRRIQLAGDRTGTTVEAWYKDRKVYFRVD